MSWRNDARQADGPRRLRGTFPLVIGVVTACVCLAAVLSMSAALAAGGSPPGAAQTATVVHQVSTADQRATLAYWTKARMLALGSGGSARSGVVPQATTATGGPPPGTPTAVIFSGVPTVGALFYTTGGKAHYCTASVVKSKIGDLVFTAAHCVYQKTFVTNIEFVPGYHNGHLPFGAWPIKTVWVRPEWKASHNVDDDFAFLAIAPSGGKNIQAVTGALTMGFTLWYAQNNIEVIGYNDTEKNPIQCATKSSRLRTNQMEFDCYGFADGVSGGPWIIGYNAKTGTGTVFGDIGGYQQGGAFTWVSYSPYLSVNARALFGQAQNPTPPSPSPSPTPTQTHTAAPAAAPAPAPAFVTGA